MVATFPYMTLQDDVLGSPPSPPANAIEAQKVALAAQVHAEESQKVAIAIQEAESGVPVPPTAEERLKAASEAVRLADEKLIEHASK